MESTDESNSSSGISLHKKAKKFEKKASTGLIVLQEQAYAAIALKPDKTRERSKHDLNVSELRDLLQAIYSENKSIPKYFSLCNRAVIRDVVLIHIANCPPISSGFTLTSALKGPTARVRLTKCHNSLASFSHKLLTVPVEEPAGVGKDSGESLFNGGDSEPTSLYDPYVLSQSAMRTWGYPLPAMTTDYSISSHVHPEGSKKRSLEEAIGSDASTLMREECVEQAVTGEGVLEGRVPALSEACRILSRRSLDSSVLVRRAVDIFASAKVEVETERETDADAQQKDTADNDTKCSNSDGTLPLSVGELSGVVASAVVEGEELVEEETFEVFRCTVSAADKGNVYGEYSSAGPSWDVVAVDCEMCDTVRGLELTRLSLLDGNGKVILDTLVKPYDEITNYREQFSGINSTVLSTVTVRFEQAQLAFLRAVSSGTVLVGHSLENDLKALKVCHNRCVDTAVVLPHPKGYPLRHKLKFLAKEYLHVTIQKGGSGLGIAGPVSLLGSTVSHPAGHSSVEDARVALQLVRLKIEMGPSFGVRTVSDVREPLVSHLPRSVHSSFIWATAEGMLDMRACVDGSVSAVRCLSNASAVRRCVSVVKKQAQQSDVLGRRHLLYLGLDCDKWVQEEGLDQAALEANIASSLRAVSEAIETNATVNRGAIVIVSTQSSVKTVLDLQRRKTACIKAMSASVWTPELEDSLRYSMQQAAISTVFLGVCPYSSATESAISSETA